MKTLIEKDENFSVGCVQVLDKFWIYNLNNNIISPNYLTVEIE